MISEEQITQKIQEEKQKQATFILKAKKEKEKLEKERSELYDEREKSTQDLEKEIKKICKPFDEKIAEKEKEMAKKDKEIWNHECEEKHAEASIRYNMFKDTDVDFDANAFKGFLLHNGIFSRSIVKVNTPLKNGIILYRHFDGYSASDCSGVSYFAVKDKKIIGFHFTRKSEHRGDESEAWGWINEKLLRGDNQAFLKTKNKYGNDIQSKRFGDWKFILGNTVNFKEIDLTDEKNKRIFGTTYDIDYRDLDRKGV